jgi:hypothetical protein
MAEQEKVEQEQLQIESHLYDDDPDDECPNCNGEGYVYSCFEEYACLHPDDGCPACRHRCDWCRPRPSPLKGGA